jgi:hypothetical protein
LLLAHAAWIAAESPAGRIFVSAMRIQKYCSPMQPGFLARERQKGAHLFLNLLTVVSSPKEFVIARGFRL